MFPFWKLVIAPVLQAAGAKRVVEVGALRGDTTVHLLELLGPEAELHVIDPLPQFDPTEHEQAFAGRYFLHREISHNVLPELPPMDVALIDGDHNWYTVYHELKMLAATAREQGRPLPVLVMHDVGWPYGRRDLYYAPERIPKKFRNAHQKRGMRPGHDGLAVRGGFNASLANARREGGPRNGVMTALDDFIAEHDQPLRCVVIPSYFGLAVVAEEARLAGSPELVALLDRLESAEGRKELLELAESVRVEELTFQHSVFFGSQDRVDRAAQRYLGILKGALLDEHYIENELRIEYLARCARSGREPDFERLRDPGRLMKSEMTPLRDARVVGANSSGGDISRFPYAAFGRHRLEHLHWCLEKIRSEAVAGDLVECGTGAGGGAVFMRGFLDAYELPDPAVWVVDSFRDDLASTAADERFPGRAWPDVRPFVDLHAVRDAFRRFDLLDDRVRFLQGVPEDSAADAPIENVALLRIDGRLHRSTGGVLHLLYDKVAIGGFVIVDGCDTAEVRDAVEGFRADRDIAEPVERVDEAAVTWRKLEPAPADRAGRIGKRRAPVASPLPTEPVALSVVVVFYNMRREAERTLHSLARAYQRGVDDLDYEVIVVENGSAEDQRLGDDFVRSFGPEFRYLDLADEATPSPVRALNRGIAMSRGKVVALMIDGAYVLTPGVLRHAMQGLDAFSPAVVATQQWYLGPGDQPETMTSGYDRAYEDRLLERIDWPTDGYRLFDVGHFAVGRDWFDNLWESNCFFVPRRLLEQVGCFDESFDMAGGGYANLDLFDRVATTPDVTVVSLLGEASFHQFHGGMTTNQADIAERHAQLTSYRDHYVDLRGRGFRGLHRPMAFIGSVSENALRTRARRTVAPAFFKQVQAANGRALPEKPAPIPDGLKEAFTDALWHSLAWKDTTWLGRRVAKCPTDLLVYQEILSQVRPDWIIETRTAGGGRTLFLASICELLGEGHVVSIDARPDDKLPSHPRITYVGGDPVAAATVAQVRAIVGEAPKGFVILGSRRPRDRMVQEFQAYEAFVAPGSYLVMEETIVNGNPVLPNFGAGPGEAAQLILETRDDFVADPSMERFGVTFNRGGFLKRIGAR